MNAAVVLSTSLILEPGDFRARSITQQEAQEWVEAHSPDNFCGHETVRLLGLQPDTSRKNCESYDEALCIKSKSRLEFGREYTVAEIEEIGVEFMLIIKDIDR